MRKFWYENLIGCGEGFLLAINVTIRGGGGGGGENKVEVIQKALSSSSSSSSLRVLNCVHNNYKPALV